MGYCIFIINPSQNFGPINWAMKGCVFLITNRKYLQTNKQLREKISIQKFRPIHFLFSGRWFTRSFINNALFIFVKNVWQRSKNDPTREHHQTGSFCFVPQRIGLPPFISTFSLKINLLIQKHTVLIKNMQQRSQCMQFIFWDKGAATCLIRECPTCD